MPLPLTLNNLNTEFLTFMVRVVISLGIGMMIGLEREWAQKDLGARTFSIVALAFTLGWGISREVSYILLLALIPLITLVNWRSFSRDRSLELTTSVALLATAVLGMLVGEGHLLVAAACGVIMTGLLAWKAEVVKFAGAVTIDEIRGALLLGMIAVVVYPLLPSGPIDPWRLIDLRAAWTVVLVISAIAFVNYVLLRIYGTRGIRWTGLLGGLVNSTATVAELASRARGDPDRLSVFALLGMLSANTAMLIRNGLILGIFARQALAYGWLSVLFMLLVTIITTNRIHVAESGTAPLRISSPISVRHALTFGALFVVITLTAELANRTFGQAGFLLVSALGGLVSSASTSAAAGILASKGALPPELAGYGVVITSMASLAFHVPMAQMAGRNATVTARLARLSILILVAGVAGLLAQLLLFPRYL
jgi:uncharacterized membrane protein (DUF4010 family)